MLFKKKRVDEFKDLLKSLFKDINHQDFDDVLKVYSKVLNKHNLLSKEDQAIVSKEYERLILELRIYMHVKETEVLMNFKNFSKIQEKLDLIQSLNESLNPATDDARETLNYSKKRYKEISEDYEHKFNEHQFHSLYLQIFKSIKHKQVERAIQEYHNILINYKMLLKYEPIEKFKPKLDKIINALEDLALVKKAYEQVISKEINIEIPNYVNITHRDLAPTPTQNFSKNFNKIHELLEKNKISEAEKLYQKL